MAPQLRSLLQIAPQLRVPTEEAAAVGGNSDAAAEDVVDIVSCMFMHMET